MILLLFWSLAFLVGAPFIVLCLKEVAAFRHSLTITRRFPFVPVETFGGGDPCASLRASLRAMRSPVSRQLRTPWIPLDSNDLFTHHGRAPQSPAAILRYGGGTNESAEFRDGQGGGRPAPTAASERRQTADGRAYKTATFATGYS